LPGAAENPHKILCYVTDGNTLGANRAERADRVLEKIRAAISAGVDWIQIREKDLPSRDLFALARSAANVANDKRTHGVCVLINDRLDIALAAGAAGVHLGDESLTAGDVIRWCREGNARADFMVGVSCHSLEQAREAESAGANYIFFGPVFDTPSKRPFGPPQGIAALQQVCTAVRIPVIAIGGIAADNARECFQAGARGIAAIRMFQESSTEELPELIRKLRED
jgi:thiamine-phosphate pyrophosphorylase